MMRSDPYQEEKRRNCKTKKAKEWHPKLKQLHCHLQAQQEYRTLHVSRNTPPLSNVWRNLDPTRVNVNNILMFIRSARKRRGKLGWNATGIGLSSRELHLADFLHHIIIKNKL